MGNSYIPNVGRVKKERTTFKKLMRKKNVEFLLDALCYVIAIIVLSPLIALVLIAAAIDFVRGKR